MDKVRVYQVVGGILFVCLFFGLYFSVARVRIGDDITASVVPDAEIPTPPALPQFFFASRLY